MKKKHVLAAIREDLTVVHDELMAAVGYDDKGVSTRYVTPITDENPHVTAALEKMGKILEALEEIE